LEDGFDSDWCGYTNGGKKSPPEKEKRLSEKKAAGGVSQKLH